MTRPMKIGVRWSTAVVLALLFSTATLLAQPAKQGDRPGGKGDQRQGKQMEGQGGMMGGQQGMGGMAMT